MIQSTRYTMLFSLLLSMLLASSPIQIAQGSQADEHYLDAPGVVDPFDPEPQGLTGFDLDGSCLLPCSPVPFQQRVSHPPVRLPIRIAATFFITLPPSRAPPVVVDVI